MPDNILLIFFGILSAAALAVGVVSVLFAMKNARENKNELMMAFWSVIALASFTFAGMCLAYFIIPILINHLF
jgi:hypothetical protein